MLKAEEKPSWPKVCETKSGMLLHLSPLGSHNMPMRTEHRLQAMIISVPWAGTAQMTTVSSVAIAPKTHDVMELYLLRVYQRPNYTHT